MNLDEKTITLGIFLVCTAVVCLMVLLEKRTRKDLQPSLIPTTPILLTFGAGGIITLVHLLNLYGLHTGR